MTNKVMAIATITIVILLCQSDLFCQKMTRVRCIVASCSLCPETSSLDTLEVLVRNGRKTRLEICANDSIRVSAVYLIKRGRKMDSEKFRYEIWSKNRWRRPDKSRVKGGDKEGTLFVRWGSSMKSSTGMRVGPWVLGDLDPFEISDPVSKQTITLAAQHWIY